MTDERPPITTLISAATASGADRWTNCPGSVALSLGLTEADQEWKSAGTKAHDIGKEALLGSQSLDSIGDDAVRVYVEYVRAMANEGKLRVEERLFGLGTSGALDCFVISGKLAHIFDFKYGVGLRLRAPDNKQLAMYAVLLKENFPDVTTVVVHLIQPRVAGLFEDTPSITSWTLPWQTIRMWKNDFEEALKRVESSNEIKAGSWCQFCLAQPRCPAYQAMVERARLEHKELFVPDTGFDSSDEEGEEPQESFALATKQELSVVEVQRIAKLFSLRKFIESWFKKAEPFLLQQLQQGFVKSEDVGYEVGVGRSNRVWRHDMTERAIADELQHRGFIDDPWVTKLIPITKAEELVETDGLWEKPPGKPKLKPIKVEAKKKIKHETSR